jgi:hypothetical protein
MKSMNVFLVVILSIINFFVSLIGVAQGIVLFIKLISFTRPFSMEMVSNEIYALPVHKQLMYVEWISSLITLLVSVGIAIVLIVFGKTPCLIVSIIGLIVGLIYSLIINRTAIGRTQYNIDRFIKRHSICMDPEKMNAYF